MIELPVDLTEALSAKRLVLFGGAGLSMPRFPSWRGMIELLLKRAGELRVDVARAQSFADAGRLDSAAAELRTSLGANRFQDAMRAIFRPLPGPPIGARHLAIARTRYAAIVTTNYDRWLERGYRSLGLDPPVYTNRSQGLGRILESQQFFILKAHGDIDDPQSWIVTDGDYAHLIKHQHEYIDLMGTLARVYTHLFVGYSLDDQYLARIRVHLRDLYGGIYPHGFLLLPNPTDDVVRRFREEQNLVVLAYETPPDASEHHAVTDVLEQLARHTPLALPEYPAAFPSTEPWTGYTERLLTVIHQQMDWYVPLSIMSSPQSTVRLAEFTTDLTRSPEFPGPRVPLFAVVKETPRLLLSGQPGTGKSTSLRQLAVEVADQGYIPLMVTLAGATNGDVGQLIHRQLLHFGVEIDEARLWAEVNGGGFYLLIDGLNEVPAARRDDVEASLQALLASLGQSCIVVTTRTSDAPRIGQVARFEIAPMADAEIAALVLAYLGSDQAERMVEQFRSGPQELPELARNPLFLKMLVELHSQTGYLPSNLGDLFRRFFSHVFSRREPRTASVYSEDEKVGVLSRLAYNMLSNDTLRLGEPEFLAGIDLALSEMLPMPRYLGMRSKLERRPIVEELRSNGVIVEDNYRIGFAHQSLSEYFAARRLEDLFVTTHELRCDLSSSAFYQPLRYLAGLLNPSMV
jgi:hypothetical protein